MNADDQQPDPRLIRLLGGADLAGLRQRLRRHYERYGIEAGGALQLANLTSLEREALALLSGNPPRASRSIRIDIEHIDTSLRNAGLANTLRVALEMLDGPIVDKKALRDARLQRWAQVLGNESRHPLLPGWLQLPAARRVLARLARGNPEAGEQLLARASAVLSQLPAAGVTRSQLAADVLGDAHALDNRQPTATIVLSALRYSTPQDSSAQVRARNIWALAGVLVNELARPALCLNLPLSSAADRPAAGTPRYFSLRDLLRSQPDWAVADRTIYVCENPNIVAIAADRLAARCAPMICTEGMPAAAQRTLLTQVSKAGARLRYHGDFDWPGIRIANFVMRTWHALPWRLGAADYEAALAGSGSVRRSLRGSAVAASWDNLLMAAMSDRAIALDEEAVVGPMLQDLSE